MDIGDTVRRIDGTEVVLTMPWLGKASPAGKAKAKSEAPVKAAPTAARSRGRASASGWDGNQARHACAARGGKADDLTLIWGIGPKLSALCNRLGFFHFDQIAGWTAAEVAWVDENLEGFKGRVTRDRWVAQARVLAAGGSAAEAERIGRGEG